MVFYTDTDENSTDRLMTYKSGEIFATQSLTDFKKIILSETLNLSAFDNLNPWLDNFKDLQVLEYCTYDLISVSQNIDRKNLDIDTTENIADFINLYCDYLKQDEKNNHLKVYIDDALIKKVWNYFYDYIFWSKKNDKEKLIACDRPQLDIDTKGLLQKLEVVIKKFDSNIKPAEKAN
ncbi:MAG: hypothetical protein ABIP79_14265 [Chitinophagaceae bacterium]